MWCALILLVWATSGGKAASLSDEEYYSMPQLFQLDEYHGCLASRGVYCLGSFELSAPFSNKLYRKLQQYSSAGVLYSNHTQVYRGVCLSRRCALHDSTHAQEDSDWFASCVNSSITADYNMSARLLQMDYCTREKQVAHSTAYDILFISLSAVLLTLTLISTILDVTLSNHMKNSRWALSWSLRQSWRSLTEPALAAPAADLRFLDGLRALSMLIVIFVHTSVILTAYFIANTRYYDQEASMLLISNCSLMVQVFFIISSFLMANKVLQREQVTPIRTFTRTLTNRIVRIVPSYTIVVCCVTSLYDRLGSGPLWWYAVHCEVETCRRNGWMNLFFLNNFNYMDKKCLGQTWSLGVDMQLYAAALLFTLLLRGRRALVTLAVLLSAAMVLLFVLAYTWSLQPNYTMHSHENYLREYIGDDSFNLLYQSPAGNAVATLMGLLLAHAHHALMGSKYDLSKNKMFRTATMVAAPSLLVLALIWPVLLTPSPPSRLWAALLAAFERPVLCFLLALLIFGFLQGLNSSLRRALSVPAATVMARLSLGVLLVHFPISRSRLGSRNSPAHVDGYYLLFEYFGVVALSYTLAVLLALLVELPTQRLYRELSGAERPTHKRKD